MRDESNDDASNSSGNINREEGVSNSGNMNRNQAQQIEDKLSDGTIPKSHVLIHKSQLSILKSKAKMYNALIKNISRDQYIGSGVADNMIGFAVSCLPQA